jgi:hypothetical protein
MASLLQLGSRTINLDLVFEIEDYGDRLRIFYAVASSDSAGVPQPAFADVAGREAQALRAWLAQRAVQLPAGEGDREAEREHAAGASPGIIPQATSSTAAPPRRNDDGFYGAERMRQMHGAGSSTASTPPDAANSE